MSERRNATVSIAELLEKQAFQPTKSLAELKDLEEKALNATQAVQVAYDNKNYGEVDALIATAKVAINEYDVYNREYTYETFFADNNPNPLGTALRQCYIPTYRLNDTVLEGVHTVKMTARDSVIDVKDFKSKTKYLSIIGEHLQRKAERFVYLTAVFYAYALDKKANEANKAFADSDKWKKTTVELNEKKVPSRTELRKALQELFDELYYVDNKGVNEWQATDKDVNFMIQALFETKKVTKLKLNLATAKKAITVATEMAYGYLNEKDYQIAIDSDVSF